MSILKVFTAFSGYDSQCMALDRLGINYELVGWSEIDRYAIIAHNAVYPQWSDRNLGDICKIDWNDIPDFELFTYSFPCTDISSAGQQRGLEEGSGTRSSLLWECKKAIETKKPKYLLMENVKALTSSKFLPYLHKWMSYLDGLGYSSYAKVLNAKDFGVPQNRERLFVVSILGGGGYSFPKPFELKLRLKDVLEEDVDERYYLSDKLIDYVFSNGGIENNIKGAVGVQNGDEPALCITANYYKTPRQGNYLLSPITCAMRGRNPDNPSDRTAGMPTKQSVEVGGDVANCITTVQKNSLVVVPKIIQVANISEGKGFSNPQTGRIYSLEGLCPTLNTMQGGGREPKILESHESSSVFHKGYALNEGDGLYLHNSNSFDNGPLNGISRTLKATKFDAGVVQNYHIRKLTPRECFRLMGVSESDIDKIQNTGISKTQQYKMAGNSIVVDVLYHIFRKLFIDKKQETSQLTLF